MNNTTLSVKNNNEDFRFKLLYALGMIFIVAGHCRNGGISIAYDWFSPYAFHLGLFVFSSGYFYKSSAEEQIGKYFLKKTKNLLLPLYLWNLFYGLLVCVLRACKLEFGEPLTLYNLLIAPIVNGHQFSYNCGGWFVIPLFMVQIYNVLIRKLIKILHIKMNEWLYFVCNLALGIIGVYLASIGYNTGLWLVLVRALYFIPFWGLGILYKTKLEAIDKLPNLAYFAIIFALQLLVITICKRVPTYTPSWSADYTDGPVLPFVIGVLGIAFWLRIAKIIAPALKNSKAIRLISDNTYSIMINHFLGFFFIKGIFALISHFTPFCRNFDMHLFKTDFWYYYLPGESTNWLILYLIAGIVVPIIMQLCINKIIAIFKAKKKK